MKKNYPMGVPGFRMNELINQAKAMQQNMVKKKEELEEREFTATAGGGAVSITLKGTSSVQSLKISPDVVNADDVEMLQDLVVAAFNEALKEAKTTSTAELQEISGGLDLPF